MAITCICILVAAGLKKWFFVSSRTTTHFSYAKTAKHRLVEDHERRSKDGQRKTTTDGEIIGADFRKFQWVQAPILSLSLLSSISPSSPPSPLYFRPFSALLSLQVGLLKIQLGGLRECGRLRHRVRAEPGRQRICLHCTLENRFL